MPESNPPSPDSGLVDVEEKVVKWWHPLALVLLLAGLFVFLDATGIGGDLRRGDLAEIRERIEAFGVLGPLVFTGLYTITTLVGFPTSPLTFAAGALFGPIVGIATAMIAATISATASFVIARHVARAPIHHWLRNNRRFQKLDQLTEKHGTLVVVVARLVNVVPFFVVNYGLGVTRVPFKTFVLWSFIARLPGTLALVLLGDAIYQALIIGDVPWLLVSFILALFAVLAIAIRQLNRHLKQREGEHGAAEPTQARAPEPTGSAVDLERSDAHASQ